MNLIQQANFLENVPKDQLAQMSQDPNGQFPPFLVLTEIQRRTMNEQNYKAIQVLQVYLQVVHLIQQICQ